MGRWRNCNNKYGEDDISGDTWGDNDTCDHAEWSYVVKCCDVDACDDVET